MKNLKFEICENELYKIYITEITGSGNVDKFAIYDAEISGFPQNDIFEDFEEFDNYSEFLELVEKVYPRNK